MCEEFGLRPSEILAEADRLPAGTLDLIVEYRHLARAIAIYERDPTAKGELVHFVKVLDHELAAEEIARKKQHE